MNPVTDLKSCGGGGIDKAVELLLETGRATTAQAQTLIYIDEAVRVPVLVVPNGTGYKVESLLHLLPPWAAPTPTRKVGTVSVHDLDSFCRYFLTHKEEGAAIFVSVSETGATFVGVMNAHDKSAKHQDHRVSYTCAPSVEWKRWMANNNKALTQTAFVEHLEDCEELITAPASADLIKLLSSLSGKSDASFKGAVNLFNGAIKVNFEEEVTLRGGAESGTSQGEMEIPNRIQATLPPFTNGPLWKADCRLRVRVQNRALTLQYETIDTHLIIRDAVNEMIRKVAELTKVEPFLGIAP